MHEAAIRRSNRAAPEDCNDLIIYLLFWGLNPQTVYLLRAVDCV